MDKKIYLKITDAYMLAMNKKHGGGGTEKVEEALRMRGIEPAGYIKGMRGNEEILRPFYDAQEIEQKSAIERELLQQMAEIKQKKKEIDRQLAEIRNGSQRPLI